MWMIKYVRFAESAFLGLICRAFLGVESHPVGVRGLKLGERIIDALIKVAPRRGAWIETETRLHFPAAHPGRTP